MSVIKSLCVGLLLLCIASAASAARSNCGYRVAGDSRGPIWILVRSNNPPALSDFLVADIAACQAAARACAPGDTVSATLYAPPVFFVGGLQCDFKGYASGGATAGGGTSGGSTGGTTVGPPQRSLTDYGWLQGFANGFMGAHTDVRESPKLDSGKGTQFAHYRWCSPELREQDWYLLDASVTLIGHRTACGVYSECKQVSLSQQQKCWDVALQGESSGGVGTLNIGNPNEGRRESIAVVTTTVLHRKCLFNQSVRFIASTADARGAPINDAPCFSHWTDDSPVRDSGAWYAITLPSRGSLVVEVGRSASPQQLRVFSAAQAAALTPATMPAPTKIQPGAKVRWDVSAGVHYIQAQPSISGSYSLSVGFAPAR